MARFTEELPADVAELILHHTGHIRWCLAHWVDRGDGCNSSYDEIQYFLDELGEVMKCVATLDRKIADFQLWKEDDGLGTARTEEQIRDRMERFQMSREAGSGLDEGYVAAFAGQMFHASLAAKAAEPKRASSLADALKKAQASKPAPKPKAGRKAARQRTGKKAA